MAAGSLMVYVRAMGILLAHSGALLRQNGETLAQKSPSLLLYVELLAQYSLMGDCGDEA
jgi:hypothetical protein